MSHRERKARYGHTARGSARRRPPPVERDGGGAATQLPPSPRRRRRSENSSRVWDLNSRDPTMATPPPRPGAPHQVQQRNMFSRAGCGVLLHQISVLSTSS
uniref:Uncharacterized protein n=1 Tax=Oryza nivara TaxID=4536 RepID=A0A0E0G321_ORYNI